MMAGTVGTHVRDDASVNASTSRGRRALRVTLLVVCQSTQSITFSAIALFLPLIREDLGISFTQAGLLSAASTLTYALMQIPSGLAADRLSPRGLFVTGVFGTNVLSLTLAQLHDFTHVLLNQAAAGFFRALIFAPGLLLVSALFGEGRRATALGLYAAGGFAGNVLLSIIGPGFVAIAGWRAMFNAIFVFGMVLLVMYLLVPSRTQRIAVTSPRVRDAAAHLRDPSFWLVGVIQYVRLAVAVGIGFWLPAFLVIDRGLSLPVVGAVIAVAALATALSNFVGGYVSDRSRRPRFAIGLALTVLAVTSAAIAVVENIPLLFVLIVVNAFFIQFYFGPLFSLPVALFGSRTAGVTSGFGNFAANLGSLTSVAVLGLVRDLTGSFVLGFGMLSVLCLIGLMCTWSLGRARELSLAAA